MRHLQSYDEEQAAQGLSDELEIAGIESSVREDGDAHSVWVINESDLEAAREVTARYAGAPSSASRDEAERIRRQREVDARPVRVAATSGGRSLAGSAPAGQLTVGLIVICVAVAMFTQFGSIQVPLTRDLTVVPITAEGMYLVRVDWSQPWRLLTPMLLHFNLIHLLFNMLWFYRLGSQIENVQGRRFLLGLMALTQVPGVLLQFEVGGPYFGGMSGVVYGLFGYTWMQARYASRGYALADQDTIWIMGWFVLCATPLIPYIANAQHALGLVFGLLAGTPAYIAFRRSSATVKFEEGSWADLNIRGFQRFRRLYFEPYVPLWFVGLAVVVLVVG